MSEPPDVPPRRAPLRPAGRGVKTSRPLAVLALLFVGAGILMVGATRIRDARDAGIPVRGSTGHPAPECDVLAEGIPLPEDVRESSGLAIGGRDPGVFWTHNDAGNDPELFAIDASGTLLQRVRVAGADLIDWEDIESAPCGEETCLYVADIGDNDADRERITVYRVIEPPATASETVPADAFHARFPDGPRDAESLFTDGSGVLYLVTKGRRETIDLYRWPALAEPGETGTLEHVRELFPEPEDNDDWVTAATSTPDRRWVGVRSYRSVYLYPMAALLSGRAVEPHTIDLSEHADAQGESLAMAEDGRMWVSSEGEGDEASTLSLLRCALPDTSAP